MDRHAHPSLAQRIASCTVLVLLLLPAFAAAGPCGTVTTFADGLAPARLIHISPSGSNATGNGSPAAPYATIAYAAAQAQPGDAIRLLPGTYPGGTFLSSLRGTNGLPIWIGGEPGVTPRPLITGSANGLHLSRARYLILHDLEIAGATGNGINCDDGGDVADPDAARWILFRNLLIRDIGPTGNTDALKLSGIRDFVIDSCLFRDAGSGGSMIDMVGCHRGLITRSRFEGRCSSGIQAKGGTADIDVRRCWFESVTGTQARACNIGGSTGFEFFRPPLSTTQPNAESRRIRITSCIFSACDNPAAFVGTVDSVFAHNTIIRPRARILRILQETTTSGSYIFEPCGNNDFSGNLIYFDRSAILGVVNVGANTAPTTFTFASNLWYAFNNPAQSSPGLPAPEAAPIIGINPALLDEPAQDYRLSATSPAIGAGPLPLRASADHPGACFLSPPSIGAYENTPPCPADFDDNGLREVPDIFAFLAAWFAASPSADFDGNSLIQVPDIFAFLAAWFAGCG